MLSGPALNAVEKRLHLRWNKWDTQVGDIRALSAQPLIVSLEEWKELCFIAERLAAEMERAELQILADQTLLKTIGLPKPLQAVYAATDAFPPATMRAIRFDFHPTREGWRVSEVNSDVPGGWCESTLLPTLFQPHVPNLACPDSALAAWGDAMLESVNSGHVVLLSAPGFLEDQQVIFTFARELTARGLSCSVIHTPAALEWRGGDCFTYTHRPKVSAIVRFYQMEWLCQLRQDAHWKRLWLENKIAVVNPTISAVSESKRFSLAVVGEGDYPFWDAFFPESRDPRAVDHGDWDRWVLKAAYSNTGDEVYLCADLARPLRNRLVSASQRRPLRWVVQRRFETMPLESDDGPVFPCIGVFVANGRAAGAYGRLSLSQVVDGTAMEAPVMIEQPNSRQ